MKCTVCGNEQEVEIVKVNGTNTQILMCAECRVPNPVGRPGIGITKKVSLTLTEENWKWFEDKANGNSSQFLRNLIWDAQSQETGGEINA